MTPTTAAADPMPLCRRRALWCLAGSLVALGLFAASSQRLIRLHHKLAYLLLLK